jgi:hypothetical protein
MLVDVHVPSKPEPTAWPNHKPIPSLAVMLAGVGVSTNQHEIQATFVYAPYIPEQRIKAPDNQSKNAQRL